MTLAETIVTGMNNQECSFFVGQSIGAATAESLMFRIALLYFGIRLVEKIIFVGIPKLYKRFKK